MITSFERDEKVLRELETIATLSNDYRDGINYSISNLEPNLTTNPLKTQDLSPLELANAEKLAKLESERLKSGNKIFDFYSDRNFTDFRDANLHSGNHPYEPNLTQKPLTSQEDLLKTRGNSQKNTQDNDTILRTFIPKLNERYMRSHVRDADIIHSFIQPNRTAKSDNALSDVVVYGENITKKPLTSQEDLLKTRGNLFITEILRVGLKDNWKGEKLPNRWVITSYEKLENSGSLYSSPLITKSEILPLNSSEILPQTR